MYPLTDVAMSNPRQRKTSLVVCVVTVPVCSGTALACLPLPALHDGNSDLHQSLWLLTLLMIINRQLTYDFGHKPLLLSQPYTPDHLHTHELLMEK